MFVYTDYAKRFLLRLLLVTQFPLTTPRGITAAESLRRIRGRRLLLGRRHFGADRR